jgi:hypothetical protein
MYLGIDPGGTTGYAIFDEVGDVIDFGDIPDTEIDDWLDALDYEIETVIIEEYRVYPHIPQVYSKMETPQTIARVKSWAHKAKVKVVEQPAQLTQIGYKYLGLKKPKKKADTHKWDAVAIGVYWLQRRGIRKFRV